MAAPLSSRPALVARSTKISTGAIVGATIGSVVGAVLILLCFLPFILRARRLRAFRKQHGEDAAIEEFGQPDFLSRSHFGDAFRRLSHSTPAQPPPKPYIAGDGQESTDQNGAEALEKPQAAATLYPTGVGVQYGLPSPISPELPSAARLESLPGRTLQQDGRTATGSLTLATQTTRDSIPTYTLSPEQSVTEAGTTSKQQSRGTSFVAPSRQGTFGSKGIADEPDPSGVGRKQSHTRRSSHLSDSVRHLAQRASAALRRDSTLSTGSRSLRSPPLEPHDDFLPHVESAPAIIEPIDTEAPGEAYSYYHEFEVPEPEPAPVLHQAASYGPPLSLPHSSTAAVPPHSHTPGQPAAPVTPISPEPPAGLSSPITPLTSRPTFGLGDAEELYEEPEESYSAPLRERRGLEEPLKRMGTQPLRPIVSDIESPPSLPATAEASVNPMDIWVPTTKPEKEHKKLVDLSTPSPPAIPFSPPPLQAASSQTDQVISQPTPDATPEPDAARSQDVEMNDEEPSFSPSPPLKAEPYMQSQMLPPPPKIAVTGGDIDMLQPSGRHTPPPSTPSNPTTPAHMPDAHLTPLQPTATPSPGSTGALSDHSAPSPGTGAGPYQCPHCNKSYDQPHKLNHHVRYHDKKYICEHEGCTQMFGTKTHLDRHVNDVHVRKRVFHCTEYNCPFSRQGGKSFPRKDNWRRHMANKHKIKNPPPPLEVIMDGTQPVEGQEELEEQEQHPLQQQVPLYQAQPQAGMMYNQGFTTGQNLYPQAPDQPMANLAYAQWNIQQGSGPGSWTRGGPWQQHNGPP